MKGCAREVQRPAGREREREKERREKARVRLSVFNLVVDRYSCPALVVVAVELEGERVGKQARR